MFKQTSKQIYIVDKEELTNIDTFVREQLSIISQVPVNKYNDTINDKLYESILSRYISGLFIKEHEEALNGIHHCVIKITINSNNYNITIGNFKLGNDLKYLNGITVA